MESVARLLREMPEGYEAACYKTGAIQRRRGVANAEDLMMLSLFHLANGCSLTEISLVGKLTKLGEMSDVAFMKRFEKCNEWFKWIISSTEMRSEIRYERPKWLERYRANAFDGSDVREKGRSGRIYRLHYAIDLFKMESVQYKITTQEVGESLCNFEIRENDLMVGDRIYASIAGIEHCLRGKGNFVLRLRKNCFKMYNEDGAVINLLEEMKGLGEEEVLDIKAYAKGSDGGKIALRVCAREKTAEAKADTQKKLRRMESKKQIEISDETKAFNEYIVVVTALPEEIPAEEILGLYRLRWQVEMYFKRLKTIMDFGELPKRRPQSILAWLNGKLMVALLLEKIANQASFSPSGEQDAQHMA